MLALVAVATARIDLKHDKEIIVDIDNPDTHQTQYHTADFITSKYECVCRIVIVCVSCVCVCAFYLC